VISYIVRDMTRKGAGQACGDEGGVDTISNILLSGLYSTLR